MEDIIRIHASSGTTGRPTYVGVTRHDSEIWKEIMSRVFYLNGIRRESRVVFAMGLTFFVGSAGRDGIENIGATFIPIGTGASERVITSIQDLKGNVMFCTPSYAIYLADYVRKHFGIEPKELGIKLISTGAEPGAGMPEIRKRIEDDWGCKVVESMGNADMAPVVFGECSEQNGMHFTAPDYVICEVINPETGESLPLTENCVGELVYTAIDRECVPLIRFRTRDLVTVDTSPCSCGHKGFRIRCIGRTDDMLIVRGVNVFPSAIRDVVNGFYPRTTGEVQIVLKQKPPLVHPPLPIRVEYSGDLTESEISDLKNELEHALRSKLIFTSEVILVPSGTLPRFEMKAKLVTMEA
jgi:phenylacetate-CoA ligase